MSFLKASESLAQAAGVEVTEERLMVELADGRVLSVPISWFPRLQEGTAEERQNFELMGNGTGIHWPLLDEDISVEGLLRGRASMESPGSLMRWRASRRRA